MSTVAVSSVVIKVQVVIWRGLRSTESDGWTMEDGQGKASGLYISNGTLYHRVRRCLLHVQLSRLCSSASKSIGQHKIGRHTDHDIRGDW